MKLKALFIFLLLTGLSFSQINNDFNNRYMLAQSYKQAGELEKAKSIYQNLYAAQPNNYRLFQDLNNIYLDLKDYNSSIQLIELRIKSNPNIDLYGLLGNSYYLMGNDDKAFEVWDNGLKAFPASETNYRVITNYAMERRAFDKAIVYLRKAQGISKNPEIYSFELANLYAVTMQYKDAADEYCMIISKNPNQLNLVESRVLSYTNKPDALSQTIKAFEDCGNSDNISFDYLLSRLYIENKSYEKALDMYEKIDDKQGNQGAELFHFAQTLLSEKQYNLSAKVYNEIIDKYPNSPLIPSAKLGYAKTLEQSIVDETDTTNWRPFKQTDLQNADLFEKVINAYQQIPKVYPNTDVAEEAYLQIGNIKFHDQNKLDEAEDYYSKIVTQSSLSKFAPAAYSELGSLYLCEGDLKKAAYKFSQVSKCPKATEDDKNDAEYNLAQVYFFQDNFKRAGETLNNLLQNLKANSANDAIELSMLINTSKGDSSALADFAEAEFLTAQKKYDQAAEKYKLIAENQRAFTLNNIAEFREAEMELALNNYGKSIKMLEKISKEGESNIYGDKALYLLAKIYQFGMKNDAKAIESYQNLLEKYPNSLYLDDARDQITKLKKIS